MQWPCSGGSHDRLDMVRDVRHGRHAAVPARRGGVATHHGDVGSGADGVDGDTEGNTTMSTITCPKGQVPRILTDEQVIAFYERYWRQPEDRDASEMLDWLGELNVDMNDVDAMVNHHVAQTELIARLSEMIHHRDAALEFYAAHINWREPQDSNLRTGDALAPIQYDLGTRARVALGVEAP